MVNTTDSKESLNSDGTWVLIRRTGDSITAVAAVSVVLSVVYDWGFYSALNISFAEAPTALSDHIHSWLVWLPKVIVAIIGFAAFEMLNRRIERGMTEKELIASSPLPRFTRVVRASPYTFMGLFGIFGLIGWILFGSHLVQPGWLYLSMILVWFMFSGWVFSEPTLFARHSKVFLCFYWIPPVIFFVFYMGQSDANKQISLKDPNYRISSESINNSSPMSSEIYLIRAFDNWILMQDRDREISWTRLEEVKKLQPIKESKEFPGVACIFFDMFFESFCTENRTD